MRTFADIQRSGLPDTPPLRRIMVATDISPNAAIALRWAIEIARMHGAAITLVHGVEVISMPSIPLVLQDLVAQRLSILEADVRDAGVEVTSRSGVGRAWKIVADAADEERADLVVAGARGHTLYSPMSLGSTADRIVRMSRAPVLTVHPNDNRSPGDIRTVLVATDFSEEAQLACLGATRLLGGPAPDRRVVLLHAWQPFVEYGIGIGGPVAQQLEEIEQEAHEMLEPIAQHLRDEGWTVEVIIRQGYAAAVVERESRRVGADLIAVGTHGRGAVAGVMLGSVAERILHHAPCPVLSVRHPRHSGAILDNPAAAIAADGR